MGAHFNVVLGHWKRIVTKFFGIYLVALEANFGSIGYKFRLIWKNKLHVAVAYFA